MTANQSTGALSTWQAAEAWRGIDWARTERHVYRLQVRIAKAIRAGRRGKAKALQWLLVRSYTAKLLAVKRVTQSQGSRTAGVDKEKWTSASKKYQAAMGLTNSGYKAQPLRRIYIPKRNGKRRPLSIPTMKDRAMQALYLLSLSPIAEETADINSYGFRPRRSAQDALAQCYIASSGKNRARYILEADIAGCFDNISHTWLLDNIPMDNRILTQWLKAGYIEKQTLLETRRGTPQGGLCKALHNPPYANKDIMQSKHLMR